ncbi:MULTISPECIES: hypothetical protein [Actinosynnema]|uniref:hypothetical protein n=1 Tax=Actinosynnema TaxID=40566 RepID=UPI0020A3B27F|nr:hypothetical protein [Actinosynnema pretiosum]MCP2092087.1 hypothetical protein [Actinosynnema pretiosum]
MANIKGLGLLLGMAFLTLLVVPVLPSAIDDPVTTIGLAAALAVLLCGLWYLVVRVQLWLADFLDSRRRTPRKRAPREVDDMTAAAQRGAAPRRRAKPRAKTAAKPKPAARSRTAAKSTTKRKPSPPKRSTRAR